jgi:hypothetical protein
VSTATTTEMVGVYAYVDTDKDGNPIRPMFVIGGRPQVMVKLKRMIPAARQDNRSGHLWITATLELARDLEWFCLRYPLTPNTRESGEALARLAAKHKEGEETVARILGGDIPPLAADRAMGVVPREYQLTPRAMCRAQGYLLLGDDTGVGKTLSGGLMFTDPDALLGMVVAPKHLVGQWQEKLAEYFPWLNTHILRQGTPYADNQKVLLRRFQDAHVLLTTYHKVWGWSDYLHGKVKTVIFDEAQELRTGPGTAKYDGAMRVARGARYVMELTATPVYNYGDEVHNVVSILNPDVLGTMDEFVKEHGGKKIRNPRALGSHLRDSGIMLVRTRKDVGRELPPVSSAVQAVDTNHRMVKDMVEQGIVAMAAKILATDTDREERWSLSGQLEMKVRHATGVAKAPYVAEFVKMLLAREQKIVLVGHHHDVYAIWQKALADYKPVLYTGQQSDTQKKAAIEAFVEGDARVFMMALRSGTGVDGLQKACSVMVFGELDWSPAQHKQIIDRLNRDGQPDPVAVFYLLSDAGSDPPMEELLELKRRIAEPITRPDAEIVEPSPAEAMARVRALATAVLRQHDIDPTVAPMPDPVPGSGELFPVAALTARAEPVPAGELVPADDVSGPDRDLECDEALPVNAAGQVPAGMVPFYETQQGLAEATAAAREARLGQQRRLHVVRDEVETTRTSRDALRDRLASDRS